MRGCLGLLSLIAGVVVYWLIFVTEGTYLGTRSVVRMYDWTARRYNGVKKFQFMNEARFIGAPLSEHLANRPGAKVLDVATGTGRTLLALDALHDSNATMVGVDHSMPMLRQAQADLRPPSQAATLVQGDAHRLMLADESVDAVSCLEALEFMADPRQVVREMIRVLKPGGIVLVSNRVGLDGWFFPRRYSGRGRLEAMLAREGLVEINSQRWQVDYDLIWAIKPTVA